MVVVPEATPIAVPVENPIVATEGVLLVHTPPVVASVSVVVKPTHTEVVPAIAAGLGLMVTTTLPCGPQQPAADCALK